jgi:ubiquinone/menaquinone biosynthesis C-methylase UbiE
MEWPVEQLWYKNWRHTLWQQVHGPKVLEIGVGTGKNISYYPDHIGITGIDLSSGMLERAKKVLAKEKKNRVTLREMDAQQMGFPYNTFDDVVATFVFCSVPDPILGLSEALRVTKPGGRLRLLEHMRADWSALASLMDRLDAPIHYLLGVHIARQTIANVKKAGWDLESVQKLSRGGIVKKIIAVKPG